MGKWDRFRMKRETVIDEYIKARKIKALSETFCKYQKLKQIITTISMLYAVKKRKVLVQLKGKFMCLIISQVWKRRTRRFCGKDGTFTDLFKNRIRYALTFNVTPFVE